MTFYRATYGPKGDPRAATRTVHFDQADYDYEVASAGAQAGEVLLHVRTVDSPDEP